MTGTPHVSRRTALAGGLTGAGALAGALTLGACSASSSPSSSGSGSSTASGGPTTVATLADITVGQAIAATVGGQDVLVARPTPTTAACFSAICTHQGCTVKPAGTKLECPCHGSVFDAATGKVLQGPAPSPLKQIPVSVRNGSVITSSTG